MGQLHSFKETVDTHCHDRGSQRGSTPIRRSICSISSATLARLSTSKASSLTRNFASRAASLRASVQFMNNLLVGYTWL